MPAAPLAPERWITDAQLYARHATVTDETGERYEARTWSEIDVVQWLARRPGARGWLVVAPDQLGEPTPYGSVAEQVARAEAAGAEVRRGGTGTVSVHVAASVTTTLGGLATDARGRAADGVWAAGADAGGIATGGYASGLAGALVIGPDRRGGGARRPDGARVRQGRAVPDRHRGRAVPARRARRARAASPPRFCRGSTCRRALAGHELFAAELELRSPPSRTAEEAVEALRARARRGRRRGRDADGRRAAPRRARSATRRTPTCRATSGVGAEHARPAAPHARVRAARARRHARPGDRDPRRQRPAHPPAAARRAGRQLAVLARRRLRPRQRPRRARARLSRPRRPARLPRLRRLRARARATLRAAGIDDPRTLWWDVRPHPRLGTVEVREMDAQTELRDVLPLAALVHCLARHEAERGSPVLPRDALDWSSFRAARDGLDAEILDEDGRVRPLREVARTLLSRLVMVAGELDCGDALEEVERLLPRATARTASAPSTRAPGWTGSCARCASARSRTAANVPRRGASRSERRRRFDGAARSSPPPARRPLTFVGRGGAALLFFDRLRPLVRRGLSCGLRGASPEGSARPAASSRG